jgi:hypothetical protein
MIKKLFLLALVLCGGGCLPAQTVYEVRDSVRVYFPLGKYDLVPELRENRWSLNRIADSLSTNYADSVYRLQRILVVGGASPEGSTKFNQWLSEKRAGTLFDYLSRYVTLPDSLKSTDFLGSDWNGLLRLVENDVEVPYREETLRLLHELVETSPLTTMGRNPLTRIQRLRGGAPYQYMYKRLFPELRASRLYLWYEKVEKPVASVPVQEPEIVVAQEDSAFLSETVQPVISSCRPFYMDVQTNLLYDALLIPNIGVEFYLGKRWSVVADWMYGWWKNDHRHRYWRAYGGGVAVRKWFGRAAKEKPLTGHHMGIYGQIFTYDFETGGRGYMGGRPGGSLWEKMNYAAGVEYGYSLPIARRLNLDFTLGVGYWGGTYYEYEPMDDCYVWQATKQRHWYGPTKAEVSLVWLIGHDNCNKKKGGKQ